MTPSPLFKTEPAINNRGTDQRHDVQNLAYDVVPGSELCSGVKSLTGTMCGLSQRRDSTQCSRAKQKNHNLLLIHAILMPVNSME
jgi:hypothetical protein